MMAHPIGNYFNGYNLKRDIIGRVCICYRYCHVSDQQKKLYAGKRIRNCCFANINQVNQALSEKDETENRIFESKCPYANGYQENQIKFEYACHRRQRGGKIFLLC